MWTCPKCGRSFSREGQGHYCGKIETVDQYIEEQDETIRAYLQIPLERHAHSANGGMRIPDYSA